MMNVTAYDLLDQCLPVEVAPDITLSEACEAMASARVSQLGVSIGGEPRGVITEQDILQHVSQNGGLFDLKVSDLMQNTA